MKTNPLLLSLLLSGMMTSILAFPMDGTAPKRESAGSSTARADITEARRRAAEISEVDFSGDAHREAGTFVEEKEQESSFAAADAIAEEKEGEVRVDLTLEDFRAALDVYPNAERLVVVENNEGVVTSVEQRAANANRFGLSRSENKKTIDVLRTLIPSRVADDLLAYRGDAAAVMSMHIDPLTPERLRQIFDRIRINEAAQCASLSLINEGPQKILVEEKREEEKQKPKQASQDLTKNALRIFLQHYYPPDWLENFLMEYTFKKQRKEVRYTQGASCFNVNEKKQNDLIFSLQLCRGRFPVAEGLAVIDRRITSFFNDMNLKEDNRNYHSDFFDDRSERFINHTKYILAFEKKAAEACAASHTELAKLWKRVALGKPQSCNSVEHSNIPYCITYAAAKAEEEQILGYSSRVDYWQAIKREIEDWQARREGEIKFDFNLEPFNAINAAQSQELSIEKFLQDEKNRKDRVASYRALAKKAFKQQEIAILWNEVANHIEAKKLDKAHQFFLAAWCLSKSLTADPNMGIIWRKAARYFKEAAEVENRAQEGINANTIANKYVEAAYEAMEQLAHSVRWKSEIKRAEKKPEVVDLYEAVIPCFNRAIEKLAQVDVDRSNQYQTGNNIDDLKRRVREATNSFNSRVKGGADFLTDVIDDISLVSILSDYGFYQVATLLRAKIDESKECIERYVQLARQKAESDWNQEWDVANAFREQEDLFRKYQSLLNRCKYYVNEASEYLKNLSCRDDIGLAETDLRILYRQAAQASIDVIQEYLNHFPQRVPSAPTYNYSLNRVSDSSPFCAVENKANDLKIAVRHLEQKQKEDEDIAVLLEEMKKLRLRMVELRQTDQEQPSAEKNNAIKMLELAEQASQEAIKHKEFQSDFINIREELKRASAIFLQAAETENEEIKNLYSQAGQSAQRAAEKKKEALYVKNQIGDLHRSYSEQERNKEADSMNMKADKLRSISDQLLRAIKSFQNGDQLDADYEKEQALLADLRIQNEFNESNKSQSQKIDQLFEIVKSVKLVSAELMTRWIEIAKTIRDAADTKKCSYSTLSNKAGRNEYHQWGDQLIGYSIQALKVGLKEKREALQAWDKVIKEMKQALEFKKQEIQLGVTSQQSALSKQKAGEACNKAKKLAKEAKKIETNPVLSSIKAATAVTENTFCLPLPNEQSKGEVSTVQSSEPVNHSLSLETLRNRQVEYSRKTGTQVKQSPGAKILEQAQDQINLAIQYCEKAEEYRSLGNEKNRVQMMDGATLAAQAAETFALAAEQKKNAADATARGEISQGQEYSRQAKDAKKRALELANEATKKAKPAKKSGL